MSETTQSGTTEGAENTAPEAGAGRQSEDDLPEWARSALTDARNDAAKYRVRARDAATAADTAAAEKFSTQVSTLSDEKSALAADLNTARLDNLKLRAALAVGIPGESAAEFADLLKGDSEEQIVDHAQRVASTFGTAFSATPDRPVDPAQGMTSENSGNPDDAFQAFVLSQLSS